MLVYTNATLTTIRAPGTAADYDIPAVAGSTRWTGSVGVTIRHDPIVESQAGGVLDVVRKTRMEIEYSVGSVIQQNDAVTYVYEGTTTTRRVDDITRSPLVGRVRIELEPA